MATQWGVFFVVLALVTLVVSRLARSSAALLESEAVASVTGRELRLNLLASQAVVGAFVAGAAWLTGVPWSAFGWRGPTPESVLLGLLLGIGMAVANALLDRVVDARALERAERLRDRLAPERAVGWASLLLVVLPVVAVSEELLFRGALVGAAATGLGVSPWLPAVLSSLVFGAVHAAQGRVGVVATALFGLAFAAAFVLTGDLLVVVVAHWLVDAVEFAANRT
ncbi:MAG: lysostaphin resistance A-like protein [Halanaeroarchaeum sp.]